MLVTVSHLFLCRYILYGKTKLAIEGYEAEKKYIYLQAKTSGLGLAISFVIVLATAILSNFNSMYTLYSMYSIVIVIPLLGKRLHKHKPKKEAVL